MISVGCPAFVLILHGVRLGQKVYPVALRASQETSNKDSYIRKSRNSRKPDVLLLFQLRVYVRHEVFT